MLRALVIAALACLAAVAPARAHPPTILNAAAEKAVGEEIEAFRAQLADAIAAGEGEMLIPSLLRAFNGASDRADLLRLLATERGFYIPSFYDVRYADDGTIAAFVPREGTGAPPVVKKAALKATDAVDPPATMVFTPDTEFGSRFLVEVVRGCANLCRFCWAGYNYLPVRAFPKDRILQLAEQARLRRRTDAALRDETRHQPRRCHIKARIGRR